MSGSENPLRVLHCADIHLGHQKVKTIDTANNIRKYLFPKLANVDLISIAGDIFHGRIALDSPDSNIVIDLFVDLLVKCYEHDVTLRVLNGTFSHDLHQNDLITQLYKKLGLPVNYKLYKVLDIEYIQHLNIHILYVPDNLPFRHKHEILTRINDLLISHGIKQVDFMESICIMLLIFLILMTSVGIGYWLDMYIHHNSMGSSYMLEALIA